MFSSVTTSTHHKLSFSMFATQSQAFGPKTTSVSVSLGSKAGGESHSWSFTVPNNALSFSAGRGTLSIPAKSLAPYGVMKLSLSGLGKVKKTTCSKGEYFDNQKLHLTGVLYFDTRSTGKHKWGHFGNKHKKVSFKTAGSVTTIFGLREAGCPIITPPNPPCVNSVSWSSNDQMLSITGGTSGKKGYLYGTRYVTLSKPKGAYRYDSVSVPAPAPKLKVAKNGSATLSVGSSSPSTGSAKLTSKNAGAGDKESCGKKGTETTTSWSGTYTNGHPGLELHEQIFGAITLSNSDNGNFSSTTS
jgi:hypothetical protein